MILFITRGDISHSLSLVVVMKYEVCFWWKKTPCWELRKCAVFKECTAYLHPELPCWQIEGTKCDEILGTEKSCNLCIVYIKYHNKNET